jgi:tRNA-dihydrouridine synthase B
MNATAPHPYPTAYTIRDIRVEPNVVLAPMEGVTDLTFRRLIRNIGGAGMTTTEFIASEGLKRGVGRLMDMAAFDPDERPIAIQIYGRRPDSMAEAARIVQDLGATVCDINMGCPSKKVCAHSGGSSLLREPALAIEIVRAVRAAIQIPLTVKMRSGFDHHSRNAPDLAVALEQEGVEGITIHWRTRTDLYGGERAVDKIAEAKSRLRIPVIGNGDITDIPSAMKMFEDTGCDGLMIGRGAIRNPWVLLQVSQHLRGEPVVEVTAAERRRVLLGYLDSLRPVFIRERAVLGRFKKIANYFTKGLPYGSELRVGILHSQTIDEAVDLTEDFFRRLGMWEAGDHSVFHSLQGEAGEGSDESTDATTGA